MFKDKYGEIGLGPQSSHTFLANSLRALGFEYSGLQKLKGRSGLIHNVDGVGIRGRNMVLAMCGGQGIGKVGKDDKGSPKERVEFWCRDALLRLYDVSALLESEGIKTDLLFFENARQEDIVAQNPNEFSEWMAKTKLPNDIHAGASWSARPIETVPPRFMSGIASSIGACFLGLQDMTLQEIAATSNLQSEESIAAASEMLKRLRVAQYFSPPTDELIVAAIGLSPKTDKNLIPLAYETALKLAHQPASNVIVPDIDYRDPIATALALEDRKYIGYDATVTVKENGREVIHHITKTPQESFVLRILKTIDLPATAKAAIEAIKGMSS
jgi:hypothetical protein